MSQAFLKIWMLRSGQLEELNEQNMIEREPAKRNKRVMHINKLVKKIKQDQKEQEELFVPIFGGVQLIRTAEFLIRVARDTTIRSGHQINITSSPERTAVNAGNAIKGR